MSAPRRCRLGVTIKPPREKTCSDLDALAGMASTVFTRVDKIRGSFPPTLNHEVVHTRLGSFLVGTHGNAFSLGWEWVTVCSN